MGTLIAKPLLNRIAADLAANPLAHGELRPIARMGGYYISLEPTSGNHRPMFSPVIDEQVFHIYYLPTRRGHDDGGLQSTHRPAAHDAD